SSAPASSGPMAAAGEEPSRWDAGYAREISSIHRRVIDHPGHQVFETMAGMRSELGNERCARHAGLRVDFEKDQFAVTARRVVIAEIRPTHPFASQSLMRRQRILLHLAIDIARDFRRQYMHRSAWRIFRPVVIEADRGEDVDHAECYIAHHRASEFLARNEPLRQDLITEKLALL